MQKQPAIGEFDVVFKDNGKPQNPPPPKQNQPSIGEFDVIFDKNKTPPPEQFQDEEVEEIMADSQKQLGGFVGGALGALSGMQASEDNLLNQLNED